MSKLQALQQQAAQAAEVAEDMNEAQKGGGGRLLPAGYAFGRLVEVVELGHQPQEFNGQKKDPAPEVQLGFALWGEGYQNEDGTPYVLRLFPMAVSRNEKARAFKLFKLLNWRGTAKTFAQLLGEAWLVKIENQPKSKTDSKLVSRIVLEGFLPPLDPVTKQPYPIPEARDDDLRLFLWDFPSKEGWDSLYIEGTYDDGNSKNFLQNKIMSATNFSGSPVEQMLLGNGVSLPDLGGTQEAAQESQSAPAAVAQAPNPTASVPPAVAVPPANPVAAPAVPQANPIPAPAVAAPGPAQEAPQAPASQESSASTATTSPSSPAAPVSPVLPTLPSIPKAPA